MQKQQNNWNIGINPRIVLLAKDLTTSANKSTASNKNLYSIGVIH